MEITKEISREAAKMKNDSAQYLTFFLDTELFAFEVLRVREVLELGRITKVPRTSAFMIGVLNLRGGVVPVVDLRRKFGMDPVSATIDTAVVIIESIVGDDTLVIGVLVDAVKEVIRLDGTEVEAPPRVGMRVSGDFISAIGKKDNHFVILLDTTKLFSAEELEIFQGKEALSA